MPKVARLADGQRLPFPRSALNILLADFPGVRVAGSSAKAVPLRTYLKGLRIFAIPGPGSSGKKSRGFLISQAEEKSLIWKSLPIANWKSP